MSEKMLDKRLAKDTAMGAPRMTGLITIFLIFGVFGGWAGLAPMESAAVAEGVVEVKSKRKTIQHLEGGIVKTLYVQSGDHVDAGALLIELDETQDEARLGIIQGQYLSAKAEEARLLAEQTGAEVITFEEELIALQDPRFDRAMAGQTSIFNTRKRSLEIQMKVLEQKISQQKSRIVGLELNIGNNLDVIESYTAEISDYEALLEDGFADKGRLRVLERESSRLQAEVAGSSASVAAARTAIGEAELEILRLERDFQTRIADQLDDMRKRILDLDQNKRAIADRLARTDIIAPVSGTVLNMKVTTVGGVVLPGEPVLDIVPEAEELVVRARLNPIDIDRVIVGQEASIRFSSYQPSSAPAVRGELVNLSADILTDNRSGLSYYSATVEVRENGQELLHNLELLPGMPAQVLIKTGERTFLQYVLAPVADRFAVSLTEG